MKLHGRTGAHARVAVLTIIPEEMQAALDEFGTTFNFPQSDYWLHDLGAGCNTFPVVVAQSVERTNLAAQRSVNDLLEQWRPEYVLLCGIAAGIQRLDASTGKLKGPDVGDVIVGTYIHNAEYNKAEEGHLAPRYLALGHPSLPLVSSYCRPLTRQNRSDWMTEELVAARPSMAKPVCHEGEIVAVDSVLGDPKNVHHAEITRRYDKAIGVDMELAGVGWAMHSNPQDVHYNPRWLCIRSVSDVVTYDGVVGGREDADGESVGAEADPHEVRNEWREPAAKTAAAFAHAVVRSLLLRERPPSTEDPGAAAYQRPASQNETAEPCPADEQAKPSDPTRTLKE